MNGKPRIAPIERQNTLTLGRDQVQRKVTSPMADAMAGITEMAQIAGAAYEQHQSAQEKYNNQLMRNWEEQLANKYKEMDGKLDQSQDPEQYDGIAKASLDDMKQTGKVFLGSKLYKKWEAEHGQNYYNSIGIDVENKKQGLLHKKAFELAKERVAENAYKIGYAATEEERELLTKQAIEDIESQGFTPLEVLALTKTLKTTSVKSHLEFTISNAPEKIATVGEDGKVISSIMDDPNSYKDLTVAEKMEYKKRAVTAQKVRKKGEDEKMQPLYQWALTMSESNPEGLQRQVILFRQDPYKFQQQMEEMLGYPVEAKKLAEMMNWTQSNLLDNPMTKAGVLKQENFAKMETLYNNFKIQKKDGKTKIKEESLNNVSSLYEVISTFNSGLKISAFNKSDAEKVEGYRNELTRQLGQKILDIDDYNLFFDESGDEMLQKEIKTLSQSAELTVEETAFIYLEARKIAARNNIDLTQDYDDKKEYAEKVEEVFSAARKEYYYKNYGVPREHVDAFLYDQKIVDLQGKSKSERAEHIKTVFGHAQRYQNEIYKGKKAMLEKDKEGKLKNVFFPPEDK